MILRLQAEHRFPEKILTKKTAKSSSVFLDRQIQLKHSFVWIIQRSSLKELLEMSEQGSSKRSIFASGHLRLIVRHSQDRRRVYVEPSLPFQGDTPNEECLCVLFADVHQYIFLYERFKAAHVGV